jgi:hypothetical protein
MNDKSLDKLVADLPARITPERDLWPEIEAELGLKKPPARPRIYGLAAAALVAACAIGVFVGLNNPTPPPDADSVITRNINVVNRSITDIREALRTNPTDAALQNLLYQAYAQKSRLKARHKELTFIRSYRS